MAILTRSLSCSALAPDDECVHVRIPHAPNLLGPNSTAEESDGEAGQTEHSFLPGILDIRTLLLLGIVKVKETRVASREVPYNRSAEAAVEIKTTETQSASRTVRQSNKGSTRRKTHCLER